MAKIGEAEAFYTGGGIWVSGMYVDARHYYMTDNWDMEGTMGLFDHLYDDDDDEYQGMHLIESKSINGMNIDEIEIYEKLTTALLAEVMRCKRTELRTER